MAMGYLIISLQLLMGVENLNKYKKKKKSILSKLKDQRDRKAPNTYAVDTRAVKQQQQDHVLKQWC